MSTLAHKLIINFVRIFFLFVGLFITRAIAVDVFSGDKKKALNILYLFLRFARECVLGLSVFVCVGCECVRVGVYFLSWFWVFCLSRAGYLNFA